MQVPDGAPARPRRRPTSVTSSDPLRPPLPPPAAKACRSVVPRSGREARRLGLLGKRYPPGTGPRARRPAPPGRDRAPVGPAPGALPRRARGAARRGGLEGQECAAQEAAAGHVRTSPGSCRPARRRSPGEPASERGASGQRTLGRSGADGTGAERTLQAEVGEGGPARVPGQRCQQGLPGAGGQSARPRSPQRPRASGPHGGHGGGAQGGRAGEAQRRAAAAVEAEALRAHRARAAALRGQGSGRPAQGAQLRAHQGGGMRGEHRAPHLLHAGDRGRRRDRLPLPPRGPRLERPNHPGPGQVQEPAGYPDGAGPAEPRGRASRYPCVLNIHARHLRGAGGHTSFPASFWLHLARQSRGHVQEALALKGQTAREGQKPHEPGRKIQGLDTLLLRTDPAQGLAATGLTCVS